MRIPKSLVTGTLVSGMLAASVVPLFAAQDLPDTGSGTVAAVFAPGVRSERILAAVAGADGRIVRHGRWPNIVVVHDAAPGLAGRLRRAGAWLVLDPDGLAGCLSR